MTTSPLCLTATTVVDFIFSIFCFFYLALFNNHTNAKSTLLRTFSQSYFNLDQHSDGIFQQSLKSLQEGRSNRPVYHPVVTREGNLHDIAYLHFTNSDHHGLLNSAYC